MIGLATHDATLLSPEQRSAQFFARDELLREISTAIANTPADSLPQHRLVIGSSGTGKTMLLARLADELPNAAYCALGQGIANPSALWSSAARALGIENPAPQASPLEQLLEHARDQGRVTLLVDDFDRVLGSLGEAEWELRETLSQRSELAVVGSCSTVPASTYHYDSAFFDFFAVHTLHALAPDQSAELLDRVANAIGATEVARALEEDTARTRSIALMTGGNPRALVTALEALIINGPATAPRDCLDHVCDRATPAFEGTLDAISAQARIVLAELARHWHPAHAKTIAARLGMPTNKVSTYLDRLSREGIVDKVSLPPGKTTGFQLRDRLFNLWFLLRNGKRDRARVDAFANLIVGDQADVALLLEGVADDAPSEWLAVELRALRS